MPKVQKQWAGRGLGVVAALAAVVAAYRLVVHVNQATVALTLLLVVLFVAAYWGLGMAIACSVAAAVCYNFFFLPPVGTLTVSDPQNLVALLVFLITSVLASRLSERSRAESRRARERQGELEVLYGMSRELLQTAEVLELAKEVPASVARTTGAAAVVLYLLDGGGRYEAGVAVSGLRDGSRGGGNADQVADQLSDARLEQLAQRSGIETLPGGGNGAESSVIPLRTGARPRGVLVVQGVRLSAAGLEALGGLVAISLEKAHAVEQAARAEGARESERLRSLMLDAVTHELRTPLTAIKAAASTLLASEMPRAVAVELLSVVDEESDRLNRLVQQAVEMAQLDTPEVRLSFAAEDLRELVRDAVEQGEAVLRAHRVVLRLPAKLPPVRCDAVWVAKLLGNLLENAAKYAPAGTAIEIAAEVVGAEAASRNGTHGLEFVRCSVRDQGPGVPEAERGLVLEKFYRGRQSAGRVAGTGMGLAIARSIVEAHGGRIEVAAGTGEQGAVFRFTLPVFAQGKAGL
ncbi:DUF4118 domain-containing protein [Acidipila sp. EB88]|uniref:DUF4118 domain-containing protein n=1 Tax=Acidipila sp. EB88 TaxID=2305226 RepID=UPI000F5FD757|nr:DUF4118 domain-containing protein [Acidipila sp. EB88]RRA48482.1 DUF4118 domain-containing protein [Acidipila sp. EB88]